MPETENPQITDAVSQSNLSVLGQAAAQAVGVSDNSLRQWHKKYAQQPAPCGQGATVEQLQAENNRLRKQLKQAEMEREILKNATAYFARQNP